MVYFTGDGRLIINGINSDEGDVIRPGTMFLGDGTILIIPRDHTIPYYEYSSTLQSQALTGTLINYTITLNCTNNADPGKALVSTVPIPEGFTYISHNTNEGVYDDSTEEWMVVLDDQQATLNLTLQPDTAGATSQTVSLDGGTATLTSNTTIVESDTDGDICSHEISLNSYPLTLANMQDGQTYTVIAYSKVSDEEVEGIYDGVLNNRLSVNNGTEILGNRAEEENVITKLTITFTYDSASEVVIRFYSQYESASTTQTDRWYGLCLQEGLNNTYNESVNLLTNPEALLDDTGYSEITIDGAGESAEYSYNFPISALTDPDSFFNGILATINSFGLQTSGVEAAITSTTNTVSDTQSEYISTTGQISIGDMADMWGLQSNDIESQTLSILIKFKNSTLTSQTFSYSNLQLILYYIEDETGQREGLTAKNIHSMNYQLYLLESDIPEGPNREISTITFPLSDGETVINHSMNSKEIGITFVVWGDTLSLAKQKLRLINQWLTNERNTLGIPIPYPLIFDFEPDRAYQVILGEPIDTDINYTSITCKAKFTVESGVALTSETKITGPVGKNNGVVRVRPVVNLLSDGSDSITITDTVTGQMVKINETIAANTLVIIDCENRTVIDENDVDYTTDLDIETVWFNFFNEYSLTINGGIIQSVEYQEGF